MKKDTDNVILDVLKLSIYSKHNYTNIRDFFTKGQWQYIDKLILKIFEQEINLSFNNLKNILQHKYENDIVSFNFQEIMPFEESFLV